MTAEIEAVLAFDVDEVLRAAREADARRTPDERERAAAARRKNRAAAFLFLRAAGRRGVRSEDPSSERLLARFRRDALRDAGVDERLVRTEDPR